LKEEYYDKILECAKEKYDFIFIDTSSNIFLDSTKWAIQKASQIFFITENNYLCIKKANQLLDIFLNTWGIWKNKFRIIINKNSTSGLDPELVNKILGDIEIIGIVGTEQEGEDASYERILKTMSYIPKKTFIDITNEFRKKASSIINTIKSTNSSKTVNNDVKEAIKC
jgi:MinD-like ATPase involved in chromosome partitioning or flagellar assembly